MYDVWDTTLAFLRSPYRLAENINEAYRHKEKKRKRRPKEYTINIFPPSVRHTVH